MAPGPAERNEIPVALPFFSLTLQWSGHGLDIRIRRSSSEGDCLHGVNMNNHWVFIGPNTNLTTLPI